MDREVPTQEENVVPEPSEAVVVAPAAPKKAADPFIGFFMPNAEIVEGQWGGMTTYQCSQCPFDSMDRSQTAAHLSIHGQTFTQGARP